MKNTIRKILFYLLHLGGFVLLYFLVRDLQWEDFVEELRSYPAWKYALGLAALCCVYAQKSWRWQILNRAFGIDISFRTALVYYFSAGFLSVFTPGRLGEFAKIYFLKRKYKIDTARATSSVILDRIWDVLNLSVFGSISLILFVGNASVFVLVFVGFMLLFSFMVILVPGLVFTPLVWSLQRFGRMQEKMRDISGMWTANRFNSLLPALILSVTSFLFLAAIPVMFAASGDYPIGLMDGIGAISISNILSFIPVTVAGFGTRELVFTGIWDLCGYPREVALSVSTAYFMVSYLGSLLMGGIVYLFNLKELYRPGEIRSMQEMGSEES